MSLLCALAGPAFGATPLPSPTPTPTLTRCWICQHPTSPNKGYCGPFPTPQACWNNRPVDPFGAKAWCASIGCFATDAIVGIGPTHGICENGCGNLTTPVPERVPPSFTPRPMSPTPTPTDVPPSPTPELRCAQPSPAHCVTPTPSPACIPVEVDGLIRGSDGQPAPGRRVTFETRPSQAVGGCVIRPSLVTVVTSAQGFIPPDTFLIGGEIVNVTIENGAASRVTVPLTGPVDLVALLATPPTPVQDTLTGVKVIERQFELTATLPFGYGPLTLAPGAVFGFSLAHNGDAMGHPITGVAPATNVGDALVVGEAAGGTLAGTYPNPSFAHPPLAISFVGPPGPVAAGDCLTSAVAVPGAQLGMVAVASPRTDPGASFTWGAAVPAPGMAELFICAVAADSVGIGIVWDMRVIP